MLSSFGSYVKKVSELHFVATLYINPKTKKCALMVTNPCGFRDSFSDWTFWIHRTDFYWFCSSVRTYYW